MTNKGESIANALKEAGVQSIDPITIIIIIAVAIVIGIVGFIVIEKLIVWIFGIFYDRKHKLVENHGENNKSNQQSSSVNSEGNSNVQTVVHDSVNNEEHEVKFCPYCGTKLPNDASFCINCGKEYPKLSFESKKD